MRKSYLTVAVILTIIMSLTTTSCIGKFGLFKKVLSWNKQVGNKAINEIVFFCFWILPVYPVSALADLLVINSIEFWSGTNPVLAGTRVIQGQDGIKYYVKCDKKGYTITSDHDGSVVKLAFNQQEKSWAVQVNDDEPITFMTFVDDTHVKMYTPSGEFQMVELSEQGLFAYQQYIQAVNSLAMK